MFVKYVGDYCDISQGDVVGVLCSEDPYVDLPRDFINVFEQYLLTSRSDESYERISTFEKILQDWGRSEGDSSFVKLLESHRGKAIVYELDDRGNLQKSKLLKSENMVPINLVDKLINPLLSTDLVGRVKIMEAVRKLVDWWGRLNAIPEKMIGHLLLEHLCDSKWHDGQIVFSSGGLELIVGTPINEFDDELWEFHSKLHERLRDK